MCSIFLVKGDVLRISFCTIDRCNDLIQGKYSRGDFTLLRSAANRLMNFTSSIILATSLVLVNHLPILVAFLKRLAEEVAFDSDFLTHFFACQ